MEKRASENRKKRSKNETDNNNEAETEKHCEA